ncbi:MAG: NmrA/HSCARG family protein [Candidatus Zixiibacteriota bacterium]|nr:MAG: NmrA/HSCARG family protein [candidate division Zixibacteria bacterium]
MAKKKTIVVVGATGAQGGGLVRAILNDPKSDFTVRALTRNVKSDKAKNLIRMGAEVVQADVNDVESLKKAFEGAYGAYLVTFYWEHMNPETEKVHARNLATAAKQAGLKHVIWSTLEDTRKWIPLSDNRMPTLMNHYKVPHFDAKGEADRIFTELGVPTTFLLTSFYWDNFINFGMGPKKGPDGKLSFTLPLGNKKMPAIAAEDIGKCAYGIFKKGTIYVGKTVGIAGEHLTGNQIAKALSNALGQDVYYNSVTPDTYRTFDFPGADDLGNMFQFWVEFQDDYCGVRDPKVAKELNPSIQSLNTWLANNKNRIPIE